ncbi:MAG: DHA2 family efflux MFS transporter permease subunit [bacterium]
MAEQKSKNLKWLVLLTVIVGTFLGRLDQTIVNLALPKIISDFGITVTSAGWIATAYILANAIFVPIWGKLGDTIGRKKVYVIGFAVFIIGSALAGFAWNLGSMIVFRVIQAIAGSADYPTAMAILAVTFPAGKERTQALGIWSSSFAAASVFGPLIGGPLIDNFGWRSIFLINIPIGIIGIIMALEYIEESVSEIKSKSFDWWGAITLGISLSALVLVLDKGAEWGWVSFDSIVSYLTMFIFGIIFVFIESRQEEPIVDLKFFSNPVFVNTVLNNFIVFMGMIGGIFVIPIFAQSFMGLTATESGYLFMPMAFMMMFAAPLGGSLAGKYEPRYIISASTLVAGVGIYLFTYLDPRSGVLDIIIPLSIMAFGMGFGMAQRTSVIASAVPQNEIGMASSVLALARNIAGAFGIAVFGTILTNSIESNMFTLSKAVQINSTSPEVYGQAIALISLRAQVSAYTYVFQVSALILFVGAIVALFMKIPKDKISKEEVMVLD